MATFTPIKNQKQTKGALLGTMLYAINKKKTTYEGQSLVSGLEQTVSVDNYIMMQTYIGAFDLDKELEALDRQRRRIQKAYQLFGDYGDAMYEGRSGN